MFRATVFSLGLVMASATAFAAEETYDFDPSHTEIGFFYSHFGQSTTRGRFGGYDGTLTIDRDDLANSSIDVEIEVASLDTGWQKRDEHLTSADFFDAAAHPAITFKSTDVTVTGENSADVAGDLTIKGTTRPVTLQVTLNGEGESLAMPGTYVVGFDAETTVLRSDFGVDMFAPAVDDEVEIRISTELHRQ